MTSQETATIQSVTNKKSTRERKSSGGIRLFAMLSLWLAFCGVVATASASGVESTGLSEPTPLMAPLNPGFVQQQIRTKNQSYPNETGTGYRPSPVDRSHMTGLTPPMNAFTGFAGSYPASFDLRSSGYVTSVKDQGQCGDCWAFAAMSSVESNTLMGGGGTYDFSENHLNVRHGFDWAACDGGNADIAAAYMTRWGGTYAAGPVYESDDPYTSTTATSISGLSPRAHLQEFLVLPDRASGTDNDNYKYALQNYGAVSIAFYIDSGIERSTSSSYWNQTTKSYYYSGSADTNHLVALVGWDDNYAASNFSTPPPGNGAFIAKNQWGTRFGNSGYFYISYYDSKLKDAHAFRKPESASNYTRAYLYDPFGQASSVGYGSSTAWGANVFTASDNETLQAVALHTLTVNSSYEVYIYTGVSGAPSTGSLEGGAVNSTGSFPYAGYHTVALSRPVSLTAGQKFAVAVKFTTPGYNYPVPMETQNAGYNSAASASAGQSYMSSKGSSWTDITTYYANANVNIQAFTASSAATQPVACTYALSAAGQSASAGGSNGTVSVTVSSGSGCAWTAVSNASWITVTAGASGSGYYGTVSFSIAANTGTSSRSGTITVGGQTYTVTQDGAAPSGTTSSADCFFNWMEKTFPQYLAPAPASSQTWDAYYYRYYSGTKAYLVVANSPQHVYYLGASSSAMLDLGTLSSLLGMAGCQ